MRDYLLLMNDILNASKAITDFVGQLSFEEFVNDVIRFIN